MKFDNSTNTEVLYLDNFQQRGDFFIVLRFKNSAYGLSTKVCFLGFSCMPRVMKHLIFGNFLHSLTPQKVEILPKHVLCVDEANGTIDYLMSRKSFDDQKISKQGAKETHLAPHQFVIPGFIDTHTHAPQFVSKRR